MSSRDERRKMKGMVRGERNVLLGNVKEAFLRGELEN